MADEDRTFQPRQAEVNRARQQGLGVGQTEMDLQRDPDRELSATDPERTQSFVADEASGGTQGGDGPVLGEGTPANVDIHKLGERDSPQVDFGDDLDGEAAFSSTHGRRGEKTDAERGQGAKTRQAAKDQISRRA